jgi:hypothetical protein
MFDQKLPVGQGICHSRCVNENHYHLMAEVVSLAKQEYLTKLLGITTLTL